jgi:hypothetical protein
MVADWLFDIPTSGVYPSELGSLKRLRMLVYLDVLIGIAVIMLGGSLIITVATQALSNLFALRGRNLQWGLVVLIQALHDDTSDLQAPPQTRAPGMPRVLNAKVKAAVDEILVHPLISDSKLQLGWWKLAAAIRFDELMKAILLLGSATGASDTLKALAESNRITEAWFNSMMDRVSQRFAVNMRLYSIGVAAVLVVLAGIDTLHLISTLQTDAVVRSGLVAAADSISKSEGLSQDQTANLQMVSKNVVDQLSTESLSRLFFPITTKPFDPLRLPGMLLSVALLSLGAPFWFTTLKNLSSLRSVVAKKEEAERKATTAPDVGDQIRWKDL